MELIKLCFLMISLRTWVWVLIIKVVNFEFLPTSFKAQKNYLNTPLTTEFLIQIQKIFRVTYAKESYKT